MPMIAYPDDQPDISTYGVVDYRPKPEDELQPDTAALLGAQWRQNNFIGSATNSRMAGVDTVTRDGLTGEDIWKEVQGTRYETHFPRLSEMGNRRALAAMKSQLDMEEEDRRIIDAGGVKGALIGLGVSIADLPTLIPGGAVVRSASVGGSVLRSAISVGAAGALGARVSELGLQATQQTRPLSESAINIGAGALFGGLLGGGIGGVMSRSQRIAAVKAMDAARVTTPVEALEEFRSGQAASAGAAAVDEAPPVLEDYDIFGKGARAVGRATAPLNPLLRAAHSPSAVHRSIMADIAETGFALERNARGEGNIAVESAIKFWDRGALAKGLKSLNESYLEARKTGFEGSRSDFNEQVSRAMRRNDAGSHPSVSKAATTWRSVLVDPLKNEAIEVGRLPTDVNVKTADSYLTRIWNSARLNADEARFKSVARSWLDGQIRQMEFKADEIRIGNRIVDADKQREAFDRLAEKIEGIEDRLSERQGIRMRREAGLASMMKTRKDLLKRRAPAELVKRLRNLDENAVMIDAVKQARAAERSRGAKQSFAKRNPILATIRQAGGVRIGSQLDSELRAMGVTPRTNPDLFRKSGGIGDVDNFVKSEDPIFTNLRSDGSEYVDPREIYEAIRSELSGVPLRSPDDIEAEAVLDNLERVAADWLDEVGLDGNSSVKEVRDYIDRILAAERNTEGMDSRISRFERELEEFDATTDKLVNERTITGAEAKIVRDELYKLETELDEVADLANASPRVSLVVDYAKTKRDLFKAKLSERTLSRRVNALKRVDVEGAANPEMLAELAAKNIELERMQANIAALKTKADKLQPMVPTMKQELPGFVSDADRADYVNEIVDQVFSTLTGRANQGMPSYDMLISERGPLAGRTFNIPDELIEDFLENDVELVMRRYARVMAADVELARMDKRMGGKGDPTLKDQLTRISSDYAALRAQVELSDLSPDAKAAELQRLAKRETADRNDIGAVRDLLRGQYETASQHTNYARVLNVAQTFNYMRTLGGVLVSSIGDAVRPAAVHGLGRYMDEGLGSLISNAKAFKLAAEDAKLAGAVTERVLQSRIATMAELADPYAQNSPFERLLANMSNVFSKATLLPWWNDMHKSIASVLTQNRIVKNVLDGGYARLADDERRYMGFVGIDEAMAERIAAQFRAHGEVEGNVHIPSLDDWTDAGAKRAFAAALNKDVDSTIVTKGVADVPLFAHTPTGRAFLQFKTFALASNQRVLMRGLQDGPTKMATGMIGMATLGMLTYLFKQGESGREISNNPGTWVAEGLERSGIFSVAFEINNTWEKVGGPGFFALASAGGRMVNPDADARQPASRYANRDAFGALLGPSFQLGTDAAQLLGIPARGAAYAVGAADEPPDLTPADVNRMTSMIPYYTLPYWRWIFEGGFGLGDYGVEPQLKKMVE